MTNQSGIDIIRLYNPLDTSFVLLSSSGEVTTITGTFIEIPNCNRPTYSAGIIKRNRKLFFNHGFSFTLFGLDQSQVSDLLQTKGWLPYFKFYNGEEYFITSPVFIGDTELNTNNTNVYPITFTVNRPTSKPLKVI